MCHAALAAEVRFFPADITDESEKERTSGAKARRIFDQFAARLKPCPSQEEFFRSLFSPGGSSHAVGDCCGSLSPGRDPATIIA